MEQNTLGVVLSYYRQKYGFSMEALASGICSTTTLSRVEAGSREIDSLMAEALLGRVGKEVTQFELLLNDEDYAMWQKRESIHAALKEKRYDEVRDGVCQYENMLTEEQSLHWQRCLAWRVQLEEACGGGREEIIRIASEALAYTIADVDSGMAGQLYNPLEIRLILVLARHIYFAAIEETEARLFRMVRCVETYYSGRMKETLGIEILLTLIELMEKSGENNKVIRYADQTIALIAKGRGIRHVAEFHYIKARAIEQLYHGSVNWEEQARCCKQECTMAYYVAEMMEEKDLLEEIAAYCEEKLTWQITEQVMSFD